MASGYRGGLDLTRWFMSGLESAAASRKKKEQDDAVRQMMGSVSEAMQPREETTFPDMGASPAVAPQDMRLGAEGAARYFQPPAAPQTQMVEPGKREIADSILKAISESPQSGDMAAMAAKLFGGYLQPPSSDVKVVPEDASLYVPGEGFRSPTPGGSKKPSTKGTDYQLVQNKDGTWASVYKPTGEATPIKGPQGKADRNTAFLMDETGQAVLVDQDSGQKIPLPPGLFGKEAYKLNNDQKAQSLDQYTTSLLKKFNGPDGASMSDEEIHTMDMLVQIKENKGFMDLLAGAPGSNLPPPAPKPWQQPAAPTAVPPKEVGILDKWLKGAPESTLTAPKTPPPKWRRPGGATAPGPGESPATNPGTGASPGPSGMRESTMKSSSVQVPGAYNFNVGNNGYAIAPPTGANREKVKEDMADFKDAYRRGISLDKLFEVLEASGYIIHR